MGLSALHRDADSANAAPEQEWRSSTVEERVEFGLFVQGYLPGMRAHDSHEEHVGLMREMELVQAADRNGWKFAWLTEHHGLTEYSHLSANEVHAGYLAGTTNASTSAPASSTSRRVSTTRCGPPRRSRRSTT